MAKAYLSGVSSRAVVVTQEQTYILFWEYQGTKLPQRASHVNIKEFLKEPIIEMEADEYPFPKVYEELRTLSVQAFKEKKDKEKEKAKQDKKKKGK